MSTRKKQTVKRQQKSSTSNNVSSDMLAELALKPSVNAAVIVAEYGEILGKQDINSLIKPLRDSIDEIVGGKMDTCQEMLMGQAHALESIFMNLARRATKQEYLKNYDVFLKLALRAQSQCRTTIETLALLKNPPIVFAQQANIAHGHQQINNGESHSLGKTNCTHAEKNNFEQNELLGVKNEQRLESRTTSASSSYDTELATVETRHRAEK